ncbi:hypothetical protein D9758_014042 [Tetrapyrgos nigripes]|uniref:Uncharacterized protein n=1 Tax=Tetrapyrgos nigripes TaxID=182062 RepID=A0A8H5FV42_9AGAR|nr:hypothetical protein D9758_014042 [Tetrapyrgos nigripes]
MAFTKSALIYLLTIATVGSVGVVAQNPNCFIGEALPFDASAIPADFTSCGVECPRTEFTLPIALPSDLFNGANVCCSTFTLTTRDGKTAQGTYAYKSSSRAGTQNLALDSELFAKLGDVSTGGILVSYCL